MMVESLQEVSSKAISHLSLKRAGLSLILGKMRAYSILTKSLNRKSSVKIIMRDSLLHFHWKWREWEHEGSIESTNYHH